MTDTNVTINAKRGCSDTGVTEELASKLFIAGENGKSTEVVAIVRFKAETVTKATNGTTRSVALSIAEIEPVVDGKLNGELVEHVRTIQLALSRNRHLAAGKDEALPFGEEDGPAPKVADLVQQGGAFFDENENGEKVLHQPGDADDASALTEGDTGDQGEDEDQDEDQGDDDPTAPHTYIDTAHATCGHLDCGLPAGAELHTIGLAVVPD